MLESNLHSSSQVVTLTYEDSNLPVISSSTHGPLATLQMKHYQNFLKRLRWETKPSKLRYFIVGEYGDQTFRPHYHAVLFNFPQCQRGRTLTDLRGKPIPEKCCQVCQLLYKTWGYGNIVSDVLTTSSAQYIAGYVLKKMTMRQDPRLFGREPEFARMSLKPGLGLGFMHEVASTFLQHDLEQTERDVPVTLRHGPKLLPLGRYLRKNLRKMVGRDEKAPQEILDENTARLQDVYLRNKADPNFISVKRSLIEEEKGKNQSQAGLAKIHKQRKTI